MAGIRTEKLTRKTVICKRENLIRWKNNLIKDNYRIVLIQIEHHDLRTGKLSGKSKVVGERKLKK